MIKMFLLVSLGLTGSVMAQSIDENGVLSVVMAYDANNGLEVYPVVQTLSVSKDRIGRYRTLSVLRIGPDSRFKSYTVAQRSEVVLEMAAGANDIPRPSGLKGLLPNGSPVEAQLEIMYMTEEVKPSGTVLPTYCGENKAKPVPGKPFVSRVCVGHSLVAQVK